jgi:hypothetical protein
MVLELTIRLIYLWSYGKDVTSGVMGRWEPQRQRPGRRSEAETCRRTRFLFGPSPSGALPYPLIPYRRACLETDRLSLTSTSQTPSFNRSAAGKASDEIRSDQIAALLASHLTMITSLVCMATLTAYSGPGHGSSSRPQHLLVNSCTPRPIAGSQ